METSTAFAPSRIKICLTCSHGGHLTEMLELQEAFAGHDVFYFCYEADTTRVLPNAYLVPNMARNPIEFVKNLFRVFRIFRRERPDLVVSTGAEIAIPVVLIAKLLGVKTLYVECGAQVSRPSFTGRVIYRLADWFYVQWPELIRAYGPRAMFRGSLIDEDYPFDGDRSAERRMRATLVQPAQLHAFSSDQPPMGLAYIASVLEQHGVEVRVIDANVEKLTPAEVVRLIAQQEPEMVCFTVTTPLLPSALAMARRLRRLSKTPILVAGGPHATVRPEEMLGDGMFDYIVRGEGEITMGELVERILQGGNADGVAGVSWRRNGEIVHNPDRPLRPDLDEFPHPDWSLFPLRQYSSLARRRDFSLPITTSRGCPYGCTFCYKGVFGRTLRLREPQHVVDEWQFLVERYGAREIAVLDDVFGADAARALTICDLLIERGLNRIPWSATNGVRVNHVTPELMLAMKSAGCYRVYLGIESGVQRVLDALQKNTTLEQARNAARHAKEAGLEVGGFFMLGNLGETTADMDETIRFALQLDLDYVQFTIATPYPGTRMYERIAEEGQLLIHSWEELASYGSAVFTHGELTPDVVGQRYREGIRKFYLRPKFICRQARDLLTWTGFKHRVLGVLLVLKLALFGGRHRGTVSGRE